jgi:RNA polymerase sigma-70 factor, ECF subfamily
VDTASSKPADLVLPALSEQPSTAVQPPALLIPGLPLSLILELWRSADAESCGLSMEEFGAALASIGEKVKHGFPPGAHPDSTQKAQFFRSLHLAELALAQSCALGREVAWEVFLTRYRSALVHAAVSITGSATVGNDLADSLYADLYGMRAIEGERRSPLASYSGRGSLLGWLRTTLVQRFRDHHRRTHRETQLDDFDAPPVVPSIPVSENLPQITAAVSRTLKTLAAEDRFLLSAYYLDRQTLFQIARTLHVHEATISRKLKRLAGSLRNQLIENLISNGLSKAAAHEALGTDPRDVEINLRSLLQTSQTAAFSNKTASTLQSDPL